MGDEFVRARTDKKNTGNLLEDGGWIADGEQDGEALMTLRR